MPENVHESIFVENSLSICVKKLKTQLLMNKYFLKVFNKYIKISKVFPCNLCSWFIININYTFVTGQDSTKSPPLHSLAESILGVDRI